MRMCGTKQLIDAALAGRMCSILNSCNLAVNAQADVMRMCGLIDATLASKACDPKLKFLLKFCCECAGGRDAYVRHHAAD